MGLDSENALHALTLRPWMVFDIETCPMPGCEAYLVDPIDAPSNYKDPAKIAAYIAEKKAKQVNDAGLDIDLCEVVAISCGFWDRIFIQTRETTTEAEMLDGFWRFVSRTLTDGGVIVGFNVLHFDLPVLLRRSLYLGVPTPRISIDKYRHDSVVDVADLLCYGRRDLLRSLGFYAKRFGIPHDDSVDGSQIAQLVAEGNWQAIAGHCEGDVETTKALALRIGAIREPLSPQPLLVETVLEEPVL